MAYQPIAPQHPEDKWLDSAAKQIQAAADELLADNNEAERKSMRVINPVLTRDIEITVSVNGEESEHLATVRYVFVRGNPARFDEPAQPDGIEVLTIKRGKTDITDLFTDKQLNAIAGEILGE